MKESTKDKKAMQEFKDVSEFCKKTGNYVSLHDHSISIAGTNYTCIVIMEDQTCTVYKNYGGLDCYEVDEFTI